MARAIDIVCTQGVTRRTRPLVISSACSGVTDALIRTSELALKPDARDALHSIDQLEARHARIARELIEDESETERVQQALRAVWEELRTLVRGVNLLRELTLRSRDQFQSVGERCSTLIFHAALAERLRDDGITVHYYDAREFFITSPDFTCGRPVMPEIKRRMRKIRAALAKGAVGVTQGFIGATLDGHVTTIGRGGSDVSAAIQGVAIDAKEIQIWTDVAGIMTCDPRIAPAASTIETISFRDASELAFFGAKVLHPETIWPAIEAGIPVRVLSSKEPENRGTVIREDFGSDVPITGISVKRGVVLAKIDTKSVQWDSMIQQAISDALVEAKVAPLAVSLSQNSALYVLENIDAAGSLRNYLSDLADLTVEKDRALITLVGPGLKHRSGIATRIFRSLGRTNCEMISYGGSDTAASFVVQEDVANRVVKRLHEEFFE
jgi:aspartate kinase